MLFYLCIVCIKFAMSTARSTIPSKAKTFSKLIDIVFDKLIFSRVQLKKLSHDMDTYES